MIAGRGVVNFLGKICAFTGASGIPLLFFGSQSFNSLKNRDIDGVIDLIGDDSFRLDGRKQKYQDAELGEGCFPEELAETNGEIYKLGIADNVNRQVTGINHKVEIKNPFVLRKIGFEKNGKGDKFQLKVSEVNEFHGKISLLVLKTKNSVNLVPVLRKPDNDYFNFVANSLRIEDGAVATSKRLIESEKKGREIRIEREKKLVLSEEPQIVENEVVCKKSSKSSKTIGKNWGLLEIGGIKGVALDWFGLGSGFKDWHKVEEWAGAGNRKIDEGKYFQTTLQEPALEAIVVKFDEVVISDKGIGDGKENGIDGSNKSKLIFSAKLKK